MEALIDFGEGEDLEEGVFAEGNVHVYSSERGSPRLSLGAHTHSTAPGPAPEGQDTVDFVRQSARRDRTRRNTSCDIRPA